MKEKLNIFTERLIEKMIEKQFNQKKLAEIIGTTQQTISNWIKGNYEPSMENLLKLCFYFNEDPNYMLGFDEIKEEHFIKHEALRKSKPYTYEDYIKEECEEIEEVLEFEKEFIKEYGMDGAIRSVNDYNEAINEIRSIINKKPPSD